MKKINPQDLIEVEQSLSALELRKRRADALFERVQRFLATFNVPATWVSNKATGQASFINDWQSGSLPRTVSLDKIERYLDANANGPNYVPQTVKQRDGGGYQAVIEKRLASIDDGAFVVVRDPCFKCGTRRDLGCEHYPKFEPIPLREAMAA